jgi:glucose-6-phosphate isomerase
MSYLRFQSFYAQDGLLSKAHSLREDALGALKDLLNGTWQQWTGWLWDRKEPWEKLVHGIETQRDGLSIYYDSVVVCGIGGSFAGTKAIDDALGFFSSTKPIFFVGQNLSEAYVLELFQKLKKRKPILVVISKSGTTTEPGIGFRLMADYLERTHPVDHRQRVWLVTDPEKGALRELGLAQGYIQFPIPQNIGGRYSILTGVGFVPLILAGYDVKPLIQGAWSLYQSLRGEAFHSAIELACLRQAAWLLGLPIHALAYLEPRLLGFGEWWKQLYGESEGKGGKGLFPVCLNYSTDLHSLGQFLQEGPIHVFQTFLTIDHPQPLSGGVESRIQIPKGDDRDQMGAFAMKYLDDVNQAAGLSALMAHQERGVPCVRLQIPRLDLFALGELMAFFMTNAALGALLLGSHPFDQPGVEAYKTKLFSMMKKS